MEQEKCLQWERRERMRAEIERDECFRKEAVRKIFPRTRADYEMLYAMVENWRKAEIKRISSMKTVAPKKAEFCLLLKKEIEALNVIERYRLELKREKLAKKELSIMEKVNSSTHECSVYSSIPETMKFWHLCYIYYNLSWGAW
jgi:hypothetical protein